MKEPRILTTSEVARRLHVTPSTVFRWIKAGWLKSSPTAGRHNRIREEDLQQFMRERGMRPSEEVGPMRVLVADGQAGTVDQIAAVIRSFASGSHVEVATDGYQALIKVGSFAPHVVIIDADMADLTGERACRAIRETRQSRGAKIVVITSVDDPDRLALLRANADAIIQGPVSSEELLAELRRLLPDRLGGKVDLPQH
jgi:excisionase family DNA binding protein